MDSTVLWKLSYGMYAVGALDGNRPCGCIINTAMQITAIPESLAISMNKDNFTHTLLPKGARFTLSILSEATEPLTISYLGFQCGRERDKWANVPHGATSEGLPYVSNCCGYLVCEVTGSYDADTHTVFFASIVDAVALDAAPPMTYEYYHRVVKGKAPKNAPTYQAEAPRPAVPAPEVAWVCSVCGYVHKGDLSAEPADYVCPICKAGKDKFVRQ